jgi:hypothetical protein
MLHPGGGRMCGCVLVLRVIPVFATDLRGGIIADGKPGLGEVPQFEIVRRSGASHFGWYPTRINGIAQDIRPSPSNSECKRRDVELATQYAWV